MTILPALLPAAVRLPVTRALLLVGLGALTWGGTGCESDSVPNYGSIRIDNDWTKDVFLYLNNDLRADIGPGRQKGIKAGDGPQQMSIRDASGNELFQQLVDIPDNAFAEYIVLENGQVVASAGNIRRPDIVGGDDEQIKLENLADYPVGIYSDGSLLATVAPSANATIDVPGGTFFTVSFRRGNNQVLFEQTLEVPRNTVIHYTVLPDGTVAATGGPIDENTDIQQFYTSSF